MANAATVGAALTAGLRRELADVAGVAEIRGQGLMIGTSWTAPAACCWARPPRRAC